MATGADLVKIILGKLLRGFVVVAAIVADLDNKEVAVARTTECNSLFER